MHAVETMAFSGAVPWHGLGHQITNPEDLISGDAFMRAAGLDWTVSKARMVNLRNLAKYQLHSINTKFDRMQTCLLFSIHF